MSFSPRPSYLQGLYLILDEQWASTHSFVDVLKQAAMAGVRLVQYRNKSGSMNTAFQEAVKLRETAQAVGIKFIVNDRCDLALAVGADGVHLGQADLPLDLARTLIGHDRLIGISTHRPDEVRGATKGGADYLGFGPVYETSTKQDHEPLVGLEGLREARALTTLPIFAIGGITPESVPDLIAAGANGVAVASAVLGASDIPSTLRQFTSVFEG